MIADAHWQLSLDHTEVRNTKIGTNIRMAALINERSANKGQEITGDAKSMEQFDSGLQRLQKSVEWKRISEIPDVTNRFNLFNLLEDAVCENAWSRIIHFLLDSTADHGLGLIPVTQWVRDCACPSLTRLMKSVKATTSETEWGTFEGRRLDILVKFLNADAQISAVMGIENKVWSGEQPRQLCDYQTALTSEFPGIPKVLLFLTPNQREPLTAMSSADCPVQPVSYGNVVSLCDALMPQVSGDLRLLVSSLREFVDRNILQQEAMKKQISESVATLYQDPEKRKIIELIIEHRPTVRNVLDKVALFTENKLRSGYLGKAMECSHDYWPEEDPFTPELRLWLKGLKTPEGYSICYMLRSKTRKPFIGDKFTVLLNAHCANEAVHVKMNEVRSKLPPRISHKWKRWRNWHVLWEGDTYQFRDLGVIDIEQLSRLLTDAAKKTFEPLTTALSKI